MSKQNNGAGPGPVRLVARGAWRVWAAGLGVLAVAERQAVRTLDAFARFGEEAAATRQAQGRPERSLPGRMLDKLEEVFDYRVTRALNALQIPTARDIEELSRRVERLNRTVARLDGSASKPAKKAAPRKTTASKKPAARPPRPAGAPTEH